MPVVHNDCFQKIAEPNSPFHSDYQRFLRGEITRGQFIARLPHIAMLGDSVCMGIYISSPWSTFWRARTRAGSNWFVHDSAAGHAVRSISVRLGEITPFVATEYTGIGALVDDEGCRQDFFRRILGTQNFCGQAKRLLQEARFPDLILISIGHNNLDWTWRCPPDELNAPDERLRRQSKVFRQNYARELRPLLQRAQNERHRVAVVIFGLINFESYFKGREAAERLRASNRGLYPHLETTYKYFVSFHPDYRRNLIRLASMINAELQTMVQELNRELNNARNIQMRYSNALAAADLSRLELLHPMDGWHASVEGHNALAEAAFSDLRPSLQFLGIQRSH